VPVAVGNVTAAALLDAGVVNPLVPAVHTTGAMFRAIEEWITSNSIVKTAKNG
jgi:hypothetical protein